jgi:thermitase
LLIPLGGQPESPKPTFVPNEVLVKFKPLERTQALLEQLPRLGATIRNRVPALDVDVIKSVTLSTEELIERLSKIPAVEYVEPNYYGRIVLTPNDPSFSVQWGV